MDETDRKIEFWGDKDDGNLTHTEMDDAIESALDGVDVVNALPETIEVCGFAHMELPSAESLARHVLEDFLEKLDDEYGNPDGDYTEKTDGMKEAAKEFVAAVLDNYTVWALSLIHI